jgi:hypothetical protein
MEYCSFYVKIQRSKTTAVSLNALLLTQLLFTPCRAGLGSLLNSDGGWRVRMEDQNNGSGKKTCRRSGKMTYVVIAGAAGVLVSLCVLINSRRCQCIISMWSLLAFWHILLPSKKNFTSKTILEAFFVAKNTLNYAALLSSNPLVFYKIYLIFIQNMLFFHCIFIHFQSDWKRQLWS